jgi:hypothetical protein
VHCRLAGIANNRRSTTAVITAGNVHASRQGLRFKTTTDSACRAVKLPYEKISILPHRRPTLPRAFCVLQSPGQLTQPERPAPQERSIAHHAEMQPRRRAQRAKCHLQFPRDLLLPDRGDRSKHSDLLNGGGTTFLPRPKLPSSPLYIGTPTLRREATGSQRNTIQVV